MNSNFSVERQSASWLESYSETNDKPETKTKKKKNRLELKPHHCQSECSSIQCIRNLWLKFTQTVNMVDLPGKKLSIIKAQTCTKITRVQRLETYFVHIHERCIYQVIPESSCCGFLIKDIRIKSQDSSWKHLSQA